MWMKISIFHKVVIKNNHQNLRLSGGTSKIDAVSWSFCWALILAPTKIWRPPLFQGQLLDSPPKSEFLFKKAGGTDLGLARVLYGTLHQYTGILWKQSLPRVWDVHGRYNSSPSKLQCHAAMPIFSLLLCCDCVPFCSAFPCEPAAGRRLRTTVHLCQKQRLPGLTVSLSFDQERPPQRKQPKEKLPKSKK